jgi:hypothetical protein
MGILVKLIAIGILIFSIAAFWDSIAETISDLWAIPTRISVLHELKQIDMMIVYQLTDENENAYKLIILQDFCRENLKSLGRDPSRDMWFTSYRLFFKNYLFTPDYKVYLRSSDRDKYAVVSAGQDKKFYTSDDLISKSGSDIENQYLKKQIDILLETSYDAVSTETKY